jgi:protein-S-isoprenylcysteine O-methyltransferase Ste14
MSKRDIALGIVLTIAAVGQVILAFVLHKQDDLDWPTNVGWAVLCVSAIFGWLPIWTLRRHGGVREGNSYTRTTQLVDSGVYSIVRHPQYLAGVLAAVALTMITPHWLVAVLGAIFAAMSYLSALYEDQSCTAKFGDAYLEYEARVPRMNVLLGIARRVIQQTQGEKP